MAGPSPGARGQRRTRRFRDTVSAHVGENFTHEHALHRVARHQPRFAAPEFLESIRLVELNAGERRLDLNLLRAVRSGVVLSQPKERGPDPPPGCTTPDIHRCSILIVVDAMRGKAEHDALAVE